jgi:cytosine/adenosine deaminase-related metal-dependent hydrolase
VIQSFRSYRTLGINIGLGTDTYPPDMIENMKLGIQLCRVVERDPTACRAEDYYDAATLGGATALGREDLGRLRPGARADLIVFDLSDPRLGQVIDPIQTMMLSGSGRNVATVIIDGRFVMENYRIPGVDYDALAEQAQRQFDGLVALYPRRTFQHPPVNQIFSSAYRQIKAPDGDDSSSPLTGSRPGV